MSGLFPSDNDEIIVPTDPEELNKIVKGKLEADKFIKQLQQENAEMRQDLTTRLTVEEALEKSLTQPPVPAAPAAPAPNNEGDNNQNAGVTNLSEDELVSKISGLLEVERTKENSQRNQEAAAAELQKIYGSDFATHVAAAAEKLGVSRQFLEDMVDTSPAGFVNLVTSTVTPPDNRQATPPDSTVNSGAIVDPNATKNNAYYRNLRQKDKKLYYSPAVQLEMMKQAEALGDAFYQ